MSEIKQSLLLTLPGGLNTRQCLVASLYTPDGQPERDHRPRPSQSRNASISFCLSSSASSRFTYTKAYKNLLNELGDQAGQHEVIAENLSTQVVHELNALVKQLKDDRRKVSMSM